MLIGDDLALQALPYSVEGTGILMGARTPETKCIQQVTDSELCAVRDELMGLTTPDHFPTEAPSQAAFRLHDMR